MGREQRELHGVRHICTFNRMRTIRKMVLIDAAVKFVLGLETIFCEKITRHVLLATVDARNAMSHQPSSPWA